MNKKSSWFLVFLCLFQCSYSVVENSENKEIAAIEVSGARTKNSQRFVSCLVGITLIACLLGLKIVSDDERQKILDQKDTEEPLLVESGVAYAGLHKQDVSNMFLQGELLKGYFHALFDGNGSTDVPGYLKNNLKQFLIQSFQENCKADDNIRKSFISGFQNLDTCLLGRIFEQSLETEPSVTSTVLCCFVVPQEKNIFFVNLGDSRAVALKKDGSIEQITRDHTVVDDNERRRIESQGGLRVKITKNGFVYLPVQASSVRGKKRGRSFSFQAENQDQEHQIMGGYSATATRSFCGVLKNIGIISEPDIFVKDLSSDPLECVVLATRIVWQLMTNEEVMSFIQERLKKGLSLQEIAQNLAGYCFEQNGHRGDATVMILTFDSSSS